MRREPVEHRFSYRVALAYLDLDELEQTVGPGKIFSSNRFAPASFREADHHDSFRDTPMHRQSFSLSEAVRDFAAESGTERPAGPIRLLTQLRYFGHYFSPLNLFYCFAADSNNLECVVAEVSNTPWKERHLYLLHAGNQLSTSQSWRFQHPKSFHVSPFMGMDATYDWRINEPDSTLSVGIASSREGQDFFQADMVLDRSELSRRSVRRMLLRYPLMSSRIVAAIYWQALLLWKKKCPFFPHP